MKFDQVIGQQKIKTQLIKTVLENRVSHAQLFLGPEGCGNLALALAYAQYMNCENKQPSDSCGLCASCTKAQKLIHPDIHFSFPFIADSKDDFCENHLKEWRAFLKESPYANYNYWIKQLNAENKQGNINAKECATIMHRLSFKAYESPYKVLIMWLPEFLDKEGNRLLKIVEEPPDNTVFLFVAHQADRVLNTILSRLQLLIIPALQMQEIAVQLVEEYDVDQQKASQIAAMSGGNFFEATQTISIYESENTSFLRTWMQCCFAKNTKELFTWNDQFAKWGRENQKIFFHYCLHFFREIILLQCGVAQLNRLTERELEFANKLSKSINVEKITKCIDLIDKSIYFIERNANSKILIMYISIQMIQIFRLQEATEMKKTFFADWSV